MKLSNTRATNRTARRQAARRGQSIIIALLVLLLLGIAGGLFITIVARNLINARRSARVGSADAYARAGITFADSRLTNSLEGADWRPPLQIRLAVPPTGARELARYTTAVAGFGPLDPNSQDPDEKYLEAGYARYDTGAGRFLLRVTYDPVNVNNSTGALPPGKYLKIESIGREGVIDRLDPTTYANNRTTDRVQSYQVAYKPIGITDFARFETNPDKRSDIANLGVISRQYDADSDGGIATPGVYDFNTSATPPTLQLYPVLTTYGTADAYLRNTTTGNLFPNPTAGTGQAAPAGDTLVPGGGSLQANMSTRFFGKNVFYLNPNVNTPPLGQDTLAVAGDILLDNYDQNASPDNKTLDTTVTPNRGQQAAVMVDPLPTNTDPTGLTNLTASGTKFVYPSVSTTAFNTYNGLVRDGSSGNDAAGLPRSISRLEPPVTDGQDSATQLPRYKALAMTSAMRPNLKNADGSAYTPAANAPSPSPFGYGRDIYVDNAADLQDDSQSVGGGSNLTDEWLHGAANASTSPSEAGKGTWNGPVYSPSGVTISLGAVVGVDANNKPIYGISLLRDDGKWKNPDGTDGNEPLLRVPYSDLDRDRTGAASDNNIVIYAEGNVRVFGVLSPDEGTAQSPPRAARHITIVSRRTAYIEGNLLKGSPQSSISVLAHDYVCINTTQFLAGPQPNDADALLPKADQTTGKYSYSLANTDTLTQDVSFGFTGSVPYLGNTALYISGTSNTTDTTGDPAVADFSLQSANLYNLNINFGQGTETRTTYPGISAATTGLGSGDIARLTLKRDINGTGDPQVERLAVLPMDIRIEAVLFAQTRSFFVIPGDWFNTNGNDNLERLTDPDPTKQSPRAAFAASPGLDDDKKRFPLYGQPIDLKITVYGSVSEARPADIAAQSEWMRKWGWIPQFHGSLFSETAGHPALTAGTGANGHVVQAIGLQIIYDPQAGYPYSTTGTAGYLRSDQFGRPLPFTPNLPVSTGLLYSGESGEPPLLQ